jgi:hypothetical protein
MPAQGIEVDVPWKFLQVGLLLADDGLVTVLEKVAAAPVPSVETGGIAGEEPYHESGQRKIARTKQHMRMVGHQCPGIADRYGFRQEKGQPTGKVFPVLVSKEDPFSVDSPYDHMMEHTCRIKTCLSWHEHLCC